MLKLNSDVFFVTSFLCSLKFLLFHRIEYPKRWNWNFSMAQFLWYDCTFKKYRPCDLDHWPMKYNIKILALHTDTHTQPDRQTGENNSSQPPPGGEVMIFSNVCIFACITRESERKHSHGAQTDVGNREVYHENKAVCGTTLMNSKKLNGESTRNILLNEAV